MQGALRFVGWVAVLVALGGERHSHILGAHLACSLTLKKWCDPCRAAGLLVPLHQPGYPALFQVRGMTDNPTMRRLHPLGPSLAQCLQWLLLAVRPLILAYICVLVTCLPV